MFILFYSHFNLFNKIDIVIWNVDQYNDMDVECDDEFANCKYTVLPISHDLIF